MLASSAAIFWDVTQCSPQRNGCSQLNNIPFTKLANRSFRSIFKNDFAPNLPCEACPIRDRFLSLHHLVSRTMAFTTRNTVNRLTRKQLHLNHVASERTEGINLYIKLEKHKLDQIYASNIRTSLDKCIAFLK